MAKSVHGKRLPWTALHSTIVEHFGNCGVSPQCLTSSREGGQTCLVRPTGQRGYRNSQSTSVNATAACPRKIRCTPEKGDDRDANVATIELALGCYHEAREEREVIRGRNLCCHFLFPGRLEHAFVRACLVKLPLSFFAFATFCSILFEDQN